MTPREGVEPVAWGVRRGSDGAIVSALMSHANAIRGAEEIAGVDLEDAYTAVPLYAHPAATAREEGEPCPPVLDEGYIGWKEAPLAMKGALANANEWLWWFIRRDNPGASGSLRDYLAALALARSTGGNNG